MSIREALIPICSLPQSSHRKLPVTMVANYFRGAGTLNLSSLISISNIPTIIAEWSALVPLVAHLASHDDEHRLVGQLALAGHLKVGLFPRLGYLLDISKLLQGVPHYFDRANARSESSQKVWDVNWGSVFTRANGSAVSIITDHALRKPPKVVDMPQKVLAEPVQLPGGRSNIGPLEYDRADVMLRPLFKRGQELHVIRMSRTGRAAPPSQYPMLTKIAYGLRHLAYHFAMISILGVLCFLGAFGSAGIILNGLLAKLVCRLLRTERPPGYLENNENHPACMLSAVHENASNWYLHMGDRGVVDWMLNKTMLATPTATRMHMVYFRFAHVVQLTAMTYVAAQKGVDGVSLVILLAANYSLKYFLGGDGPARKWLEAEGVSIDAHTFRFSGRTPMIGAVHMLSEARDAAWMENLLVPCPRIKVWLEELKCVAETQDQRIQQMQALSPSDKSWVLLNTQLAVEASRLIQKELSHGKITESLCVDTRS